MGSGAFLGVLENRKICRSSWNSDAALSSPQPGQYTDYPTPAVVVSRTISYSINFKIGAIFKKYVPTESKHCVSIINKVKVKVKFTL